MRDVGHMEQGFPRGAGDACCLDILPVALLQEQGFPRGAEPILENLRSNALADVDFRIWLEGCPLDIREVGRMEQGLPRGAGDARCLDILPVALLQEQGFPRGAEPIPENLRSKALADVDFRIWLEGCPLDLREEGRM